MGQQGGGCSLCRILNILITLAILGAGGYVLWYFLGKPSSEDIATTFGNIDFGDFTGVLENFTGITPELFNTDPFVGDNTTNVWRGTTGEGGLSLELLNALDDTWQSEFTEAIGNWENCQPDALTLTTTQVDVDHTCSQVDGVMKVCNGNYGDTGWLGINEVIKTVPDGIIQSSVAKMNEYYLNNAAYEERLYTMCHEVGHGFGLPHTDENFNNKDLGNCLDYTSRPENNLLPGEFNCNRLKTMYGTVDGSARLLLRGAAGADSAKKRSSILDDPILASEYDRAMEELKIGIMYNNKHRTLDVMDVDQMFSDVDNNEWCLVKDHARGGALVRRLNANVALEVYVLYPRN